MNQNLMVSHILYLQDTKTKINQSYCLSNFLQINSVGPNGITTFYKTSLSLIYQEIILQHSIEIICTKFQVSYNYIICVINVYKPPLVVLSNLISTLKITLSKINVNIPTFLVGDFNIDNLNMNAYKTLNKFLNNAKFYQQITQTTTIYGSTLDHIGTNTTTQNTTCATNYCYWFDHSITYSLIPRLDF